MEFEDEDNEDNEDEDALAVPGSYSGHQAVSQIREWGIQRYVNQPLLLSTRNHRRFYIHTYVLAAGNISVYVYRQMLALFAPRSYTQSAGKGLKSAVEGFFAASVATAVDQIMFKGSSEYIPEELQEPMNTERKDLVQVFTRKHQQKW